MSARVGGTGITRRTAAGIYGQHRLELDALARTIKTAPAVVQRPQAPPPVVLPPVLTDPLVIQMAGLNTTQSMDEDATWRKIVFADTPIASASLFTFDGTDTVTVHETTTVRCFGLVLILPDPSNEAVFMTGVGINGSDPEQTATVRSIVNMYVPASGPYICLSFDVIYQLTSGDTMAIWARSGVGSSGTAYVTGFPIIGSGVPGGTHANFVRA